MIKLEENEKLIAIFRKHSLYIIVKIAGIVLLAIIPLFGYPFLEILYHIQEGSGSLITFFYFIYLALLWIIGFAMWTNYYLDMWLLTDKSLIDVDQIGLFAREISHLRLDRIQDITDEVIGVLHTLLHIGTVHVQSAGGEKEFVIRQVSSPNHVRELIQAAYHKQVEEAKTVKIESGEIETNSQSV